MTRVGQRLVGALGLAAGLSFASAAEPAPGVPPESRPPEGGLAGATQRELQDLSAWQRGAHETPPAAAALTMPVLQAPLAVETPVPGRPSPQEQQRAIEELRRRRQARNWLLEAMRKPAAGDQLSASAEGRQAREEALAELWMQPGGKEAGPTLDVVSEALRAADEADAQEALSRDKKALNVENPLDAFLRSWMTPRDFALLGEDSRSGGAETPLVPPPGAYRAPAAPAQAAPFDVGGGGPTGRNPYLLDLPTPDAVSLGSPFPPVPVNAAGVPGGMPAPVLPTLSQPLPSMRTGSEAVSPPLAPDVRYQPPPSVDQRHFPQLKRF